MSSRDMNSSYFYYQRSLALLCGLIDNCLYNAY
ncbi:hypothetical protein cce_4145 [Crocosphaera subtropica ATCC 51142]|uniref:Uncharacterized protein n=1 Tax=Crocosphaera subtropica (strain ATCC 51142 / BH68) TaxID=43989 RepID=B1WRQ2_CROS5|nr:hypothetical protein cce_4145 [Crocosphaera subtropica ATCC 51142]